MQPLGNYFLNEIKSYQDQKKIYKTTSSSRASRSSSLSDKGHAIRFSCKTFDVCRSAFLSGLPLTKAGDLASPYHSILAYRVLEWEQTWYLLHCGDVRVIKI